VSKLSGEVEKKAIYVIKDVSIVIVQVSFGTFSEKSGLMSFGMSMVVNLSAIKLT